MYTNSSPEIPHRQPDLYQETCRERAVFGPSPSDGTGMDAAALASFTDLRGISTRKKKLQICTIRSERYCSEICGK